MKTGQNIRKIFAAAAVMAVLAQFAVLQSCSTTRVLADGEYRLASSDIVVLNDKKFNAKELEPYIKQKPNSNLIFGWNPFLNVYNWGGQKNTFFPRLFRKLGKAPVVYESDKVGASTENISRHLEYLGYYGSNVDADVKVKRKLVKVTYNITLGKQFPIKEIHYALPDNAEFSETFLTDSANVIVKAGMPLSESTLEEESQRSSTFLRNAGYYGFSKNYYFFQADTLTNPGYANLEYRINEYTRNESPDKAIPLRKFRFDQVNITYPEKLKIRENVLKNLNTIKPGNLYCDTDVNNTYSRLSALNVINSVNVDIRQIDTSKVDANISLSTSKLQGFKFNIEASSNSSGLLGISPGLSYYHKNIFRGGEVLNLSFTGNFQFKPRSTTRSTEFGISAGLKIPKFVFIPVRRFKKAVPSTEVKASYNYQDRPEYKRNIISYNFGYTGSYKNLYFQFYPTQLNIVRMFSIDAEFWEKVLLNTGIRSAYTNHFDLGIGGTLYYTTCTDVNPKRTYHYFRLQLNEAGNILSLFNPLIPKNSITEERQIWGTTYSQYVRGEFSMGKTWVFGKNDNHAIATRFLVGAGRGYGNSYTMPFEQEFYSGGASSLRGWQSRAIGPGTAERDSVFVIPNQTGDFKLEANLEYRFGLFWKFNGAIFADAGNIWSLTNNWMSNFEKGKLNKYNFIHGIALDWGAGLRLDLSFILVRVDLGLALHDPSKDAGYRWRAPDKWFHKGGYAVHFGVGYPF